MWFFLCIQCKIYLDIYFAFNNNVFNIITGEKKMNKNESKIQDELYRLTGGRSDLILQKINKGLIKKLYGKDSQRPYGYYVAADKYLEVFTKDDGINWIENSVVLDRTLPDSVTAIKTNESTREDIRSFFQPFIPQVEKNQSESKEPAQIVARSYTTKMEDAIIEELKGMTGKDLFLVNVDKETLRNIHSLPETARVTGHGWYVNDSELKEDSTGIKWLESAVPLARTLADSKHYLFTDQSTRDELLSKFNQANIVIDEEISVTTTDLVGYTGRVRLANQNEKTSYIEYGFTVPKAATKEEIQQAAQQAAFEHVVFDFRADDADDGQCNYPNTAPSHQVAVTQPLRALQKYVKDLQAAPVQTTILLLTHTPTYTGLYTRQHKTLTPVIVQLTHTKTDDCIEGVFKEVIEEEKTAPYIDGPYSDLPNECGQYTEYRESTKETRTQGTTIFSIQHQLRGKITDLDVRSGEVEVSLWTAEAFDDDDPDYTLASPSAWLQYKDILVVHEMKIDKEPEPQQEKDKDQLDLLITPNTKTEPPQAVIPDTTPPVNLADVFSSKSPIVHQQFFHLLTELGITTLKPLKTKNGGLTVTIESSTSIENQVEITRITLAEKGENITALVTSNEGNFNTVLNYKESGSTTGLPINGLMKLLTQFKEHAPMKKYTGTYKGQTYSFFAKTLATSEERDALAKIAIADLLNVELNYQPDTGAEQCKK